MRGIFSVCSGGVRCIKVLPTGDVICGGGDGSVTQFSGKGDALVDDRRVYVAGAVNSISVSADGQELLAGKRTKDSYSLGLNQIRVIVRANFGFPNPYHILQLYLHNSDRRHCRWLHLSDLPT